MSINVNCWEPYKKQYSGWKQKNIWTHCFSVEIYSPNIIFSNSKKFPSTILTELTWDRVDLGSSWLMSGQVYIRVRGAASSRRQAARIIHVFLHLLGFLNRMKTIFCILPPLFHSLVNKLIHNLLNQVLLLDLESCTHMSGCTHLWKVAGYGDLNANFPFY